MNRRAVFAAILAILPMPWTFSDGYFDGQLLWVWCPPVARIHMDGAWHRGRADTKRGCIGFNGGWIVPLNWPKNWIEKHGDKPRFPPGPAMQMEPLRWPKPK